MSAGLREGSCEGSPPLSVLDGPLARDGCEAQSIERLERAKSLLLGELALADSPYSGRNTACVLDTGDNLYGGHSLEFANGEPVSAEAMALGKIASAYEQIEVVYVAGEGIKKAKHAMPTPVSYDLLTPHLSPEAKIVLVKPDDPESYLVIDSKAHRQTYEPKPFSAFDGTPEQVEWEIERNTILEWEDVTLMRQLNHAGAEDSIHYYLTGSASGRGGASNLVKRTYDDLDIIAVTDLPREQAEACFEDTAEVWYEGLKKGRHDVALWPSGEVRKGVTYTGTCFVRRTPVEVDLFVARTLEDATVRPEYIDRNFFHKVS